MSTTEIEQTALNMGWIPKDKFRGDESKWVDAEQYVERGQTFLPFIKAENRKLQEKLEQATGTIGKLQAAVTESTTAIEALKKYNSEMNQARVQQLRKDIMAELAEAKRSGDIELEVELQDKLTDTKAALKEAQTTEVKPNQTNGNGNGSTSQIDPEVARQWDVWVRDNGWWNDNEVMRAMAVDMAGKMNASGELKATMTPMERYEAVGKKVIARYEELTGQQARGTSKVESGRTSDTGGATTGKSFSSLPPEAKAACASFAKDLVGKGKTYAKLEDWQKKYAADYYGIA
jgi:hypothetical protein